MRHLSLVFLLLCSPLLLAANQDWARARTEAEARIRQQLQGATLVLRWEAADPPTLPACARIDYQWPEQPRGKVFVLARCRSTHSWTARLPAWISLVAPLPFARASLPREHLVEESDIEWRTAEVARYPEDAAVSAGQVTGRVTRQAIGAGQVVRSSQLRMPWLVRRGQQVRIRAGTDAFSVSSEGMAQSDAGVGERVRVRTAGGQIIEGTVQDDGSVHIAL